MTNEEIAIKLEGHEHEIGSLKHRMEDVEKRQDDLEMLASSVSTLAAREERVESDVKEIKHDVKELNAKPAERWDKLISTIIGAVAGAVIAWMASGMPGA